jgi:hypothetical protein
MPNNLSVNPQVTPTPTGRPRNLSPIGAQPDPLGETTPGSTALNPRGPVIVTVHLVPGVAANTLITNRADTDRNKILVLNLFFILRFTFSDVVVLSVEHTMATEISSKSLNSGRIYLIHRRELRLRGLYSSNTI